MVVCKQKKVFQNPYEKVYVKRMPMLMVQMRASTKKLSIRLSADFQNNYQKKVLVDAVATVDCHILGQFDRRWVLVALAVEITPIMAD